MELTHSKLIEIGYKWCLNSRGCGFAFKDLVTLGGFGEVPDIIGFNSAGTFLLEAKTSRSDFLQDKKKKFRQIPEYGMGDWRFFICKKDLIRTDELPMGWGLIEVNEKGKARTKYNPFGRGNVYSQHLKNKKHLPSEIQMMYSALRRLQEKNLLENIYNK